VSIDNHNTVFDNSLYLRMGTSEIIAEINKLPVNQRLALVEITIKKIREEEKKQRLSMAAESMYEYYVNDPELNVFSSLDHEDFYEAR